MAAEIRAHARELIARPRVPPLTVDEMVASRGRLLELSERPVW